MTKFQGFAPYKEMFDTGKIQPGQTIVVGDLDYEVLPLDPQDRHPVYRVLGRFDVTCNVKNFLKTREWWIKEAPSE